MRMFAFVVVLLYSCVQVARSVHPGLADFLAAVIPLTFMGANMLLYLAYLMRSERDESIEAWQIGELGVYILYLTAYGSFLSGRFLMADAQDKAIGFVMMITMFALFIGFFLGAYQWKLYSLYPQPLDEE